MKLQDDFFEYVDIIRDTDKTEYHIRLNSGHSIYKDHFPGNPITPGVCIIQIVKELASENLNRPLFLQKIVKIRYFKAINPVNNVIINVTLNISEKEAGYNVSATISWDEIVFAQLSMYFILQI
jgi:3-hydroxyacyl-[acyl-carrier-protein] dehydratase